MRGPVDRQRLALASVAFVLLVAPRAARAENAIEPHHLTYRASGDGCPDEGAFRREVALRLGVDPFVGSERPAPHAMTVTVEGTRQATVTLADATGKKLGRREIPGPRASCAEMVADAAFAASVAIDPTVLARPAPTPPPEAHDAPPPAPTPTPTPAREPEPSPVPPPSPDALEAAVRLAGLATFGLAPAGGFGVSAGLEVKRTWLSASLGGGVVLPPDTKVEIDDAATRRPTSATLSTTLFFGDVSGCAHLPPAALQPYGCATLVVGQLRGAASGIARPKESDSVFVAAGPRLGVRMPASQTLAIDAHVDVPFALTRTELRIDDRAAWSSPVVAAVFSLGVRVALH